VASRAARPARSASESNSASIWVATRTSSSLGVKHRHTVISPEIIPLGIRDHRFPRAAIRFSSGSENRVAEHALGVVGQYDDIGPRPRAASTLSSREAAVASVQRRGGFLIRRNKLLGAGDEPCLRRGRPVRGDDQRDFDARN